MDDRTRTDDWSWPAMRGRSPHAQTADIALARWTPTYVLAPRAEGYDVGEELYVEAEDERVRVVSVSGDGTAEAMRLHDLADAA